MTRSFAPAAPRLLRACTAALLFAAPACGGEDISLGDGRPQPARVHFSTPARMESIWVADGTDDDPSLTADLLDLFFDSKRDGGAGKEDIWHAARQDPGEPWGAPEIVAELNSAERETGIALSADGLTLWFSSDRASDDLDVFTASRTSRAEAFSEPSRVEALSSDADDLVSAVDPEGRRLFLARRADDSDDYDLFVATREEPATEWTEPVALGGVNTDAEESDGFPVGPSELVFTRSEDLYLAGAAGAAFEGGSPLEDLNSDDDDRDAWCSSDLRYVVFSSDRDGDYALYEATRE